MYCDVILFLFIYPRDDREDEREQTVKKKKKKTEKDIRARRNRDRGYSARAAAKRNLESERQIRSFMYQFAKRQNTAINVCLFRHGSTSSPNGRGAGSKVL